MDSSNDASVLLIADEHKILQDIQNMRNNRKLNDVQIILDDGVVDCNKFILSARSEYFQKMLDSESNFKEASCGKVKIEGCKKSVMNVIVDFFYTGAIKMDENLSLIDKLELLDVSRMMMLENENVYTELLEKIILEIKSGKHAIKMCVTALDIVDTLKLEDSLRDSIISFLNENDHYILGDEDAEDITNNYITKLPKDVFLRLILTKNLSQDCVLSLLVARDYALDYGKDSLDYGQEGKKIDEEFNETEKKIISKVFNLQTISFRSLSSGRENSILIILFSSFEIKEAMNERYHQLRIENHELKVNNLKLSSENEDLKYKKAKMESKYLNLVVQMLQYQSNQLELPSEDENESEEEVENDIDEDNPFDPNNQIGAE